MQNYKTIYILFLLLFLNSCYKNNIVSGYYDEKGDLVSFNNEKIKIKKIIFFNYPNYIEKSLYKPRFDNNCLNCNDYTIRRINITKELIENNVFYFDNSYKYLDNTFFGILNYYFNGFINYMIILPIEVLFFPISTKVYKCNYLKINMPIYYNSSLNCLNNGYNYMSIQSNETPYPFGINENNYKKLYINNKRNADKIFKEIK